MLQEAATKSQDHSCGCFDDSLRNFYTCDLCYLSEIMDNFYCFKHDNSHESYDYKELDIGESSSLEKDGHHDCRGCACELLQKFPKNTPVEISTSKVKNVLLYYQSIDPSECAVSFHDPENMEEITADCRDIYSIRYNKP